MSNNGVGAARFTIPESIRKTIHSIREISGKQHSDEDIYSVLKDCSMDPNDTAQKLLYLDTFHEVKRKRDKKKEISGFQGRGNHSANHAYPDAVGGRNGAPRRENGANHLKGPSTTLTVVQKTNSNAAVTETKASTVTPNAVSNLPNGGSSPGRGPQLPAAGAVGITEDSSKIDIKKPDTGSLPSAVPTSAPNQLSESVIQVQQGKSISSLNDHPTPTIPASVSGVYSSASEPVLAPSLTQHSGAVGAIKWEVGSQQGAAGQNHMQGNKHITLDVGSEVSKNARAASTIVHSVNQKKLPSKSKANEHNELSGTLQPHLSDHDTSLVVGMSSYTHSSQGSDIPLKVVSSKDAEADDSSCSSPEQTVPNGHVTFPNHFKVPEALKSVLTFGSFDANSELGTKNNNDNGCDIYSTHAIESSHGTDETAKEPSSSNRSISSTVQADHLAQPESPQEVFEKVPKSQGNIASTADSKYDKATQEMVLLPEGHQNPTVQISPNNGFGIMPTMQGGHLVRIEGHETQAQDVSHLSGFVNEKSTASTNSIPSPSTTPPLHFSIPWSQEPIFFDFRAPYPPSCFLYGHYYHPYLLPPMHQFLSHNGLPQQPSTGSEYLTPAASAPGVKFPHPQFKPGTSTGNPTPVGIQPLYGSYGSSPMGFNPAPAVTSGSSASNEDLSASQLKESQIYTTGPPNNVSAWISPPGQELSNLHLNSLYHLTSQGQHLTFSPAQVVPPTVNPHLQQSQAGLGDVETVAHPSGVYQQTQLAQINWNTTY